MEVKLIRTSSKRKQIAYLSNILFSILLFFDYYFRRKNLEALMKDVDDPKIPEFIYLIFLISLILSVIFFLLSRRKKIIGKLDISSEVISIISKNEVLSFNIKDLKAFSIKTDYIIPQESKVGLISSFNNWLYLDYMDKIFEYQFIVDSYFKGNQLKALIKQWENLDTFTFTEAK